MSDAVINVVRRKERIARQTVIQANHKILWGHRLRLVRLLNSGEAEPSDYLAYEAADIHMKQIDKHALTVYPQVHP